MRGKKKTPVSIFAIPTYSIGHSIPHSLYQIVQLKFIHSKKLQIADLDTIQMKRKEHAQGRIHSSKNQDSLSTLPSYQNKE